jgi:hypothetical protein
MQDFRQQAVKNGVTLIGSGACQFCGAVVEHGVAECLDLLGELAGRVRKEREYGEVHLFSVDAHALQHPEIHGRLNNHVHLLSLCLMIERGASSAMGTRKPAVEKFLALGREWPPLAPPAVGERGVLTVRDIAGASVEQRPELARRWGEEVWEAWRAHQPWVRRTLDRLMHD